MRTSFILLAVLALGCPQTGGTGAGGGGGAAGGTGGGGGGSAGGAGGGAAGLSVDAYCRQTNERYCLYGLRCGTARMADCQDYFDKLLTPYNCAAEKASIKDGRLAYSEENAKACADFFINTASCTDFNSGASDSGCADIWTGRVADGQPCFLNEDCAKTSYCSNQLTCPGVCQPRKPNGADAGGYEECLPPAQFYDGRCVALVKVGGSCARRVVGDRPRCEQASFCNDQDLCESQRLSGQSCSTISQDCKPPLVCQDGTCLPMAKLGESCLPGFMNNHIIHCQYGLFCDWVQATGQGTCTLMSGRDGGCLFDLDCKKDLYCAEAVVHLFDGGSQKGTCQPMKTSGASCTRDYRECMADLYCTTNGKDAGLCLPRKAAGAACEWSKQCETSHQCKMNSCQSTQCVDPTP